MDDMTVDVGEAAFEAVVVVAEPLVIKPEEVQDGGVEFIDASDIDGDLPAELISPAVVLCAGFDASTREDAGEAAGIVITA